MGCPRLVLCSTQKYFSQVKQLRRQGSVTGLNAYERPNKRQKVCIMFCTRIQSQCTQLVFNFQDLTERGTVNLQSMEMFLEFKPVRISIEARVGRHRTTPVDPRGRWAT